MKTYIKPELRYEKVINSQVIANGGLADWVQNNDLQDMGVTIYEYSCNS